MINRTWTLANLPPMGTVDVGQFGYELFEIGRREQERQQIPERCRTNYRLYRGDHWQKSRTVKDANKITINLFAANVQRTVANLTARKPEAEVVDVEGIGAELQASIQSQIAGQPPTAAPGMAIPQQNMMNPVPNVTAAKILTASTHKWWKDTKQQHKIRRASLIMEIDGTVVTKPYWDWDKKQADIGVFDVMGFIPAPGKYEDPGRDMPYCIFLEAKPTEEIERVWELPPGTVQPVDVYTMLGWDREELRPAPIEGSGGRDATVDYSNSWKPAIRVGVAQSGRTPGVDFGLGLLIELWIRDYGTYTRKWVEQVPVTDAAGYMVLNPDPAAGGAPMMRPVEMSAERPYPGNIRRIILTYGRAAGSTDTTGAGSGGGSGLGSYLVLEDKPNPNINEAIPPEIAQRSYLWDRLPCNVAYSYEDLASFYGFSAAEQVGDLNFKIDEIVSRVAAYVMRSMFPPLVIPKGCGITRRMLNSKPNLVLMPAGGQLSQYIKFLQIPQLPRDFFEVLNLLIQLHDRVYQIEDADRGVVPDRVKAAAAIVALQERNAVLIQDKLGSIEYLCEEHGKEYISLEQQFGLATRRVKVDEMSLQFAGVDFRGTSYGYTIESGSTMPRTTLQIQDQLERYFTLGAVDRQALLENSGIPGWQRIIERVGEGMLAQALQVLIQAGLPREDALALQQMLIEPGQGPGGANTKASGTSGGKPGDRGSSSRSGNRSEASRSVNAIRRRGASGLA